MPRSSTASGRTHANEVEAQGEGGVLQISSDRDDQVGEKDQTPKKLLGLPTKPQKIPRSKINPQQIPCRIFEP